MPVAHHKRGGIEIQLGKPAWPQVEHAGNRDKVDVRGLKDTVRYRQVGSSRKTAGIRQRLRNQRREGRQIEGQNIIGGDVDPEIPVQQVPDCRNRQCPGGVAIDNPFGFNKPDKGAAGAAANSTRHSPEAPVRHRRKGDVS